MDSQCPSCGGFCKQSGCERADYVPPKQEPFFTEANGFPQRFVPKDQQKQAIISLTDQCAALVRERDELQKQVWQYEKLAQRTLVLLTTQEVAAIAERVYGSAHHDDITFGMELQIKLKEKNT